ncbi:MAG: hypothetical protein MK082_06960 [Phycisphaerales bacterium]|nr:hypothetical protein [Phycisphaerales bacterium]
MNASTIRFVLPALVASIGLEHAVHADESDTVPRYITVIHCEPQESDESEWPSLVNMIKACEDRGIKACIQFSDEWIPFIVDNSARLDKIRSWRDWGHEISAHHHTLDHPSYWDGYSNDPDAADRHGYQGDMQDFRWLISSVLPANSRLTSISTFDDDMPAGIPFQVGGDGGPGPDMAVSIPTLKWLTQGPAWNLTTAALEQGGTWYSDILQTIFLKTPADSVFGIAIHPHAYHEGEEAEFDAWLDFLAAQDPGGTRSATPTEILTPYAFTAGDTNYDGTVDGSDLAMILAAWGTEDPHADLNADRIVDGSDLATVLANWTIDG